MPSQGYPPAHTVAPAVRAHFQRHIDEARAAGDNGLAAVPEDRAIAAIIEAAFWASLRREEGYIPKISLAYVAPEDSAHPLKFDSPLALQPLLLTKVAPAVERAGIHLAVWKDGSDGFSVWGTVRNIPTFCFVLEVAAPGLLVVKHHRRDPGKFVNVVVLEGDQIKIVDEGASKQPDCPSLLNSLLGFGSRSESVLVRLAVSMRGHGRGGALLVVPAGSNDWRDSIIRPISYAIAPPFGELAQLAREEPPETQFRDRGTKPQRDALTRAVDAIAGLTAVDGATVMTREYDVLAFGAKISRRKGSALVEQVMVTEPIEDGAVEIVRPSMLGGTRHLSAAQFVHDQRDTLALVASVDGHFTVFAWSGCDEMVHAHRVEALLL
jgi:Probable sensor domain DACNV